MTGGMDRVGQLCLGCRGERGTGDNQNNQNNQPEGQQRGCSSGDAGEKRDDDVGGLLKSSQIYQRCSDSSCLCFLVLWLSFLLPLFLFFLRSSSVLFLSPVSPLSLCIVHLGTYLSLLSGLFIDADCLQLASLTYSNINIYVTLLLSTSALSLSSCRHIHRRTCMLHYRNCNPKEYRNGRITYDKKKH